MTTTNIVAEEHHSLLDVGCWFELVFYFNAFPSVECSAISRYGAWGLECRCSRANDLLLIGRIHRTTSIGKGK